MAAELELSWLEQPDEQVRDEVHALVAEVAAAGGAVGWLVVPEREEVVAWLDGVLGAGARLLLARREGELVGAGHWVRSRSVVLQHTADIGKVMTRPRARRLGVARALTSALVEDAQDAGVEGLTLSCRGNNHGALGLYAGLGFVVTGRRPDWIAVGDERFDQVLLHLDLRVRRGTSDARLVRHGGRREGPGSS